MGFKDSGTYVFLTVFWRTIFMVGWPIVILPVTLINTDMEYKCLYVVILMAGYWVSECLPTGVIAFIPLVFFPLMNIAFVEVIAKQYLQQANMMFVAGIMIAISIEYSGLNVRIALNWIRLVGTSHRKLHLGLAIITMFISMWIVNTAATAMMLPIIDACLRELEANNLGAMYTYPPNYNELSEDDKIEAKRPTKITTSYYLISAYASTIGGCGTLVGTGTNLVFKGLYESKFPESEIAFVPFAMYNIPPMILSNIGAYFILQIMYMGMFRPKTEEAELVKLGQQNEYVTKNLIKQKIEALGRISFHELMTSILFALAITLFVFRYFDFMPGWSMMFPKPKFIRDATAGLIACTLYFYIPAKPDFYHVFDDNEATRPTKSSSGILTWKVCEDRMPWGTVLLLASGFGLAEGMKCSRLSVLLGRMLKSIVHGLPNMVILFIVMMLASFITELTSNVAVANILLPIIAELSINLNVHPVMLMLPVCIMCSHAFMLPVGTPPNALVAPACNMPTWSMIKAGFFVKMTCLLIWWGFWPITGVFIFDASTAPSWLANANLGNGCMGKKTGAQKRSEEEEEIVEGNPLLAA